MKEKNRKEEKIRKLEREGQASYFFQSSPIGFITTIILLLAGIGSIFIYHLLFNLSILISIIFGFITWIVLGVLIDKIVVKYIVRK